MQHLLNRRNLPTAAPVEMKGKEVILSNPDEVVDGFNDFFVNVGFDLASYIKVSDGIPVV